MHRRFKLNSIAAPLRRSLTNSAALGQTQASAASGQSRIDANRSTDAADHEGWNVLASGSHRKTCATLAKTHWRSRSRVGSDMSTRWAIAVSNAKSLTDPGRRSAVSSRALSCEFEAEITTRATASIDSEQCLDVGDGRGLAEPRAAVDHHAGTAPVQCVCDERVQRFDRRGGQPVAAIVERMSGDA